MNSIHRLAMLIVACSVLVGCGQESQLKDLVRERLNDPESAKFKESLFSKSGDRACLAWNAKNKMGGYGDWQVAEFQKVSGAWRVLSMNTVICSEESFRMSDVMDAAEGKAKSEAVKLLVVNRPMSELEAMRLVDRGFFDCRAAYDYVDAAKELARARPERKARYEKQMQQAADSLAKGKC